MRPNLRPFLILLPATLTLMIPAFINGSPFYDFDSGDYIDSGIRLSASLTRPMFYSLFILLTSLGFSLWLTVFFQSMFLAWSLRQLLEAVNRFTPKNLLLLTATLTVFSPLGRLGGQIMSDVFTSCFLILCSAWIIGGPEWLKRNKFLIPAIAFCFSTHLGHSFLLLAFLPFLIYRYKPSGIWSNRRSFYRLGAFFSGIVLLTLAFNYGKVKRFTLSPAGHAFQLAKLAHTGALQQYLNETCPTSNCFYCAYKDSIPRDFNGFLWSPSSPMAKAGGIRNGWQINQATINQVNASPLAMKKHWVGVRRDFTQQCLSNSWVVGWFVDTENTGKVLQKHFPAHFKWAQNARWDNLQINSYLDFIFRGALIAGMIYILIALAKPSFPNERLWILALLILVFTNHLAVAVFSIPDNRLAARVVVVLLSPLLVRFISQIQNKPY